MSSKKLDMSLEDLIKSSRSKKPAAGAGGGGGGAAKKKPAAAAAAGGKKAGGGGKAAAGQQGGQKKQLQKPGIKPKGGQQQQQLGTKGGISKGGSGARPATKGGMQLRGRPDVRVVPRPRPGMRGPPPGATGGYGGMPGYGMAHPGMMMQPMMAPPMMMQMQQHPAPGVDGKWPSDLFDGTVVSSNTSSKLLISNLDHKVTDEDIRELFGTVGSIKDSGVHYDRNGRSAGTAFVVFERRADALAAFNRYNNVALDNKKMSIEVVEQAVPRGTFKTLSSGINVSRAQQQQAAAAAHAAGIRGRGVPHGDFMQE